MDAEVQRRCSPSLHTILQYTIMVVLMLIVTMYTNYNT